MQIPGEHFWDTYSPVVKMTMVHLFLTLSLLLGLHTRKLIPLKAFLKELTPILQLSTCQPLLPWNAHAPDSTILVADLFEDNAAAYELATAPKLCPRTKHIALKYHHFRQHVVNGTIRLHLIGTKDQLADLFTKALDKPTFLCIQKILCGW
jgi:hypothetical protein